MMMPSCCGSIPEKILYKQKSLYMYPLNLKKATFYRRFASTIVTLLLLSKSRSEKVRNTILILLLKKSSAKIASKKKE